MGMLSMHHLPKVGPQLKPDGACMNSNELFKLIEQHMQEDKTILTIPHRITPRDEIQLIEKGYRCVCGASDDLKNPGHGIIYTMISWPSKALSDKYNNMLESDI